MYVSISCRLQNDITYCAKFVGVSGVISFRPSSVFIILLYCHRRRRPAAAAVAAAAAAAAGHLLTYRRVFMGSAVVGRRRGVINLATYELVCTCPCTCTRVRVYVYTQREYLNAPVCVFLIIIFPQEWYPTKDYITYGVVVYTPISFIRKMPVPRKTEKLLSKITVQFFLFSIIRQCHVSLA